MYKDGWYLVNITFLIHWLAYGMKYETWQESYRSWCRATLIYINRASLKIKRQLWLWTFSLLKSCKSSRHIFSLVFRWGPALALHWPDPLLPSNLTNVVIRKKFLVVPQSDWHSQTHSSSLPSLQFFPTRGRNSHASLGWKYVNCSHRNHLLVEGQRRPRATGANGRD